MLLGCIGDDFTGSSDLANTLSKNGMRVTQYNGIPQVKANDEVEAGIIALKSRNLKKEAAIETSLEALEWLLDQGCEQILFKYCSTFDSTKEGNIGPVAQALGNKMNCDRVIFCPAFPEAGRRIFSGHLFVQQQLLSDSSMKNHPLTPMTDANLVRWLSLQSEESVGLVDMNIVRKGADAIAKNIDENHQNGHRFMIVDAIDNDDLFEIGKAIAKRKLITGGSGIAMGLPNNFKESGRIKGGSHNWQGNDGMTVAFSGSCSLATQEQVAFHKKNHPSYELDVEAIIEKTLTVEKVKSWVLQQTNLPLVYSTANPDEVKDLQEKFGRDTSAEAIEMFFGQLAKSLVDDGIEKIISAGGETSGAVVKLLAIDAFEIGPEIAAGVPAVRADNIVLALKSGNFGQIDFFEQAEKLLSK